MSRMFVRVCLILVQVGVISPVSSASWDYSTGDGGPSNWVTVNSKCGGSKQSPIDIITSSATYESSLTSFTLKNFAETSKFTVSVNNNGHSVKGTISPSGNDKLEVTGAGLSGTYQVEQFHLHWGSTSGRGSEHTKNGKQYAAELHIVCWDTSHPDFATAVSQENGLAVLGFFIEEGGSDNTAFTAFENTLSNVANKDTTTTLASFNLRALLPSDISDYYRYSGSLTTPSCDESVVWTVFESTIKLSTAQMNKLRGLYQDNGATALVDNYRPVQAIGNRVVYSTNGVSPTAIISVITVMVSGMVTITLSF